MSHVQRFPIDWNMTDFHQRLRRLRTARKLTQTRVAELLGVSPRVYTRWENGDATPLFGTVVKIAPELNRLCRKVNQLSDEDQKALGIVLDSLVKRSRVGRAMAEL